MKTRSFHRPGFFLLALLSLCLPLTGCGSSDGAFEGSGSSRTTVSGSTSVGGSRTLNLTANRDSIALGDTVLVNAVLTCSVVDGNQCFGTAAAPFFSARPASTTDGSEADLDLVINYTVSSAGTISQTTSTFKLAKGKLEDTSTPKIEFRLGASAGFISFPVTLTGVQTGKAIVTAQSLDAVSSIIIDVFDGKSVIFPK